MLSFSDSDLYDLDLIVNMVINSDKNDLVKLNLSGLMNSPQVSPPPRVFQPVFVKPESTFEENSDVNFDAFKFKLSHQRRKLPVFR